MNLFVLRDWSSLSSGVIFHLYCHSMVNCQVFTIDHCMCSWCTMCTKRKIVLSYECCLCSWFTYRYSTPFMNVVCAVPYSCNKPFPKFTYWCNTPIMHVVCAVGSHTSVAHPFFLNNIRCWICSWCTCLLNTPSATTARISSTSAQYSATKTNARDDNGWNK